MTSRDQLIEKQITRARDVIRRQHKALTTEYCYLGWLRRYFKYVFGLRREWTSEHNFRHAYGTHCLDRGTNISALAKAMGHSQIQTTAGYCHAEALSVPSPLEFFMNELATIPVAFLETNDELQRIAQSGLFLDGPRWSCLFLKGYWCGYAAVYNEVAVVSRAAAGGRLNQGLLTLSHWALQRTKEPHNTDTTLTLLKRKVAELVAAVGKADQHTDL